MPRETTKQETLTPKQAEVLRLTQQGFTPREIATKNGVTTQNVYLILKRLRDLGHI